MVAQHQGFGYLCRQSRVSTSLGPPGSAPPYTQGGSYPEQQGECLHSAGALCKAGLHPVHSKLQDLIQLLPWGHRRDRLSHSPASSRQGPTASCPAALTFWVLVHQPCEALGSCGGREGAVAGAAQCQQLPEQPFLLRNCHLDKTQHVTTQGHVCSVLLPMELAVDPSRRALWSGPLPHPAPHQLTLRGKEQTKAMRRATRRLCASKYSPSCGARTMLMSSCSLLPACANIIIPCPCPGIPAPTTQHTSKGWKEQGKLFWGRKETSPSRKRGTT